MFSTLDITYLFFIGFAVSLKRRHTAKKIKASPKRNGYVGCTRIGSR